MKLSEVQKKLLKEVAAAPLYGLSKEEWETAKKLRRVGLVDEHEGRTIITAMGRKALEQADD